MSSKLIPAIRFEEQRGVPTVRRAAVANAMSAIIPKGKMSSTSWLILFASISAATALCTMVPNTMAYLVLTFTVLVFFLSLMTLPFGGMMTAMAGFGTTAVFIWYAILTFQIKDLPELPDTWQTVNYVIAGLAAIHCVLIALGASEKKYQAEGSTTHLWYFMSTWITMAILFALLTVQHVTVTYFRTNG